MHQQHEEPLPETRKRKELEEAFEESEVTHNGVIPEISDSWTSLTSIGVDNSSRQQLSDLEQQQQQQQQFQAQGQVQVQESSLMLHHSSGIDSQSMPLPRLSEAQSNSVPAIMSAACPPYSPLRQTLGLGLPPFFDFDKAMEAATSKQFGGDMGQNQQGSQGANDYLHETSESLSRQQEPEQNLHPSEKLSGSSSSENTILADGLSLSAAAPAPAALPIINGKTFGCSWEGCGKYFKRKTDLTRHYRIHLNDRPFLCGWPDCGKAFLQRSAVKIHYRTHTGEKPNHCPHPGCGKAFNDNSSLTRHRRTHKRETPFPCTFRTCRKSFTSRDLHIGHLRDWHREMPLEIGNPDLDTTVSASQALGDIISPAAEHSRAPSSAALSAFSSMHNLTPTSTSFSLSGNDYNSNGMPTSLFHSSAYPDTMNHSSPEESYYHVNGSQYGSQFGGSNRSVSPVSPVIPNETFPMIPLQQDCGFRIPFPLGDDRFHNVQDPEPSQHHDDGQRRSILHRSRGA